MVKQFRKETRPTSKLLGLLEALRSGSEAWLITSRNIEILTPVEM